MQAEKSESPGLQFSRSAVEMTRLLKERLNRPQSGLRIAIIGDRGHGGYEFFAGFDDEPLESDLRFSFPGFELFIDPESHRLLQGARVDFADGPEGTGYVIEKENEDLNKAGCSAPQAFREHCSKCHHPPGKDR